MRFSGVEVKTLIRPEDRANDRSDMCVESGIKLGRSYRNALHGEAIDK